MPLESPNPFPTADRLGRGRYLVQCQVTGQFGLGSVNTMMDLIAMTVGERLFINGPFYYIGLGTTTLTRLPDGIEMSTGGSPEAASGGPSGKGYPNPGA